MSDYIFARQGAPAIYGKPLEAELGATDALRGIGSYVLHGDATAPTEPKKTRWVWGAALGVAAWMLFRAR